MRTFYHTDCDGKCSAAIVHKYYQENFKDVTQECIPINYSMDFPFDTIEEDEHIILVDYSLQREGEFQKLLEITPHVTWIDHHITAINKHGDLPISGIRRDGVAGCELTWEYYFGTQEMPWIVKYLGDYDVWTFKYKDVTKHFQTGIKLYDTEPTHENWYTWFTNELSIDPIIEQGKTCLKYQENKNRSLVKGIAFFAKFEGYRAVCCNGGGGSVLFDSVAEDYDIMLPFSFDGNQWTVSIFTNKDIDCSVIASKYGGGGHKGAAGFQCKELPFRKE